MAVLFIVSHGQGNPLGLATLDGHDAVAVCDDAERPVRQLGNAPDGNAHAILLRQQSEGGEGTWVLIAKAADPVAVNGQALPLGIRALRHKDEIRVGDTRAFFSTERLARVEPFPGAEQPVFCARSKLPIEKGTPAVRCPGCGAWHIQTEELPAWTYGQLCAMGDYPTDLGADFRWVPDEL